MKNKTKRTIGVLLGGIVLLLGLMSVLVLWPTIAPQPVMAPPPEMMAPPPHTDPLRAIDRVLERMTLGNIAFNTPRSMNLYDSALIHLVLGVERTIEDLKRIIEEEGEKNWCTYSRF